MNKRVKFLAVAAFGLFVGAAAYSQGVITASAYFKTVSDYYSTINDYEVDVDIVVGKKEMHGKASFNKPDLMRIDFSKPMDQVIIFNGNKLTVYLPDSSAVLEQELSSDSNRLNTASGLSLLSRYYVVSYEIGQEPVPLDEGSSEQVIKLILTRRSVTEAFRTIKLAISADTKTIRRVEATPAKGGDSFVFNFSDYVINENISNQRFIYDPPSSANNYNNFLYTE